ncbi:MAG: hypothetical protein Q9O74_01925 [Planctomycetota bacterium]|nr:hypothetical protein [Planctomycetota bacterium]
MNDRLKLLLYAGLAAGMLFGCGKQEDSSDDSSTTAESHAEDDHDHVKGDGHGHSHAEDDHDDHDHDHGDDDHSDEISIGTAMIGDTEIECWQGHGEAQAGKELHLVVKLSSDDKGTAIVRAWIGTADRLASAVGKGEYDSTAGVYDIHAEAPDPLPADAQWWVEIESEDGTKQVGSLTLR